MKWWKELVYIVIAAFFLASIFGQPEHFSRLWDRVLWFFVAVAVGVAIGRVIDDKT
ncbi:MAG: hypothetical protein V1696_03905 [Candidatus Jorgensenbacteria bacterium]